MQDEQRVVSRRVFLAGSASGLALAGPLGSRKRSALKEPGPMLPPVPAILLSVKGKDGQPDEVSVVWTFVVNGSPPQVGVSVDHTHVAHGGITEHGQFVLNVPVAEIIVPFDHVDMNTHKVGDKYKLSGLTRGKAMMVNAPTVEECPIHLECKVIKAVELPPSRTLFIADVVATTVVEGICDEAGRLKVSAANYFGMTPGSGEFYTMGKLVGHIGETVGRSDIKY